MPSFRHLVIHLAQGFVPPELHDRAAPRRLPRSELRVSPPLGGLGSVWDFHRIPPYV
jgi:hypothetical protein